jgi:glyoxylase-like metal-dependent hydrolase (beta-lactamase superfamily II)
MRANYLAAGNEDSVTNTETYRVYAVKYATRNARRIEHFLNKESVVNPDAPMPMDYFVWLVQNDSRTLLVDTGFGPGAAQRRGRTHLRQPAEGLKLLGIDAAAIEDVVITHMHYDHAGTVSDFANARLHLQERELRWVTSSEMFARGARGSFEVDDVVNVVRGLYGERLILHEGDWEFAPGISVHHVPGHTPGIQVVRVNTQRGWVVLASDTTHYYENMETGQPFTTTYDAAMVLAGFDKLRQLAESEKHIVPGHDPLVVQRYPAAAKGLDGIVMRLDAEPMY